MTETELKEFANSIESEIAEKIAMACEIVGNYELAKSIRIVYKKAPVQDMEYTLNPEDLQVSTYWPKDTPRSSWVHTPEYGVTVIHKPTGIYESCHESTSVHKNRVIAYNRLAARVKENTAGLENRCRMAEEALLKNGFKRVDDIWVKE